MIVAADAQAPPNPMPAYWFRIGSVALISFLAFESLAVGAVLPRAAEQFGATAQYSMAFGVAFAAMIVAIAAAGPWTDRSGVRTPLVAGGILFVTGLVLVGSANGMTALAAGRAVQGFGSGLLSVVLYAMVGRLIPTEERPRVFAAYSTAWVVPSLVGPAIAGLIAEGAGWRWVFLGITAPAAVALAATLRGTVGLDESGFRTDGAPRRDVLIAALVAGTAIAIAQFSAPRHGTISLALTATSLVVALAAARRMLPDGSFTARRGIPRLVLANLLMAGAFFAAEIYLPLYLVHVEAMSAFTAGSVMTGAALAWAGTAQVQARIPATGAMRARLAVIGAFLVAVSLTAVTAAFAAGAPWPVIFTGWAVAGSGMGLIYPTLSVLMLDASPPDQQGVNSSALKLADSVGTALVIACAGILFARTLPWGHAGFAVTLLVPLAAGVLAVLVTSRLTGSTR